MKKQNSATNQASQIDKLKKANEVYKFLIQSAANDNAAAKEIKAENEQLKNQVKDLNKQVEDLNRQAIRMKSELGVYYQYLDVQRDDYRKPKKQTSFLLKPVDQMTNEEINLLIDYHLQTKINKL